MMDQQTINRMIDSLKRLEEGHFLPRPDESKRCDICQSVDTPEDFFHYQGCPFHVLTELRETNAWI